MTKRRRSAHAEFEAWARRATQGVVSSHVYLGLKLPTFDRDALVKDPEVALQLGAAMLLGRPIVFVMEERDEDSARLATGRRRARNVHAR